MDNQSEVIQQQMEATRTSLQDKLETLEEQVKTTVQNATGAVGDTVESVKDAVQETVETVKDAVQDTVQSVKESFDIAQHIQNHPWTMFLGATALGFMATRWLIQADGVAAEEAAAPSRIGETPNGNQKSFSAQNATSTSSRGFASRVADHYRGEIAQVKALAVGTLGALVRDALMSLAPPALGDHINKVANDLTGSMGGRVIAEPILKSQTVRTEEIEGHTEGKSPDNFARSTTTPGI